MELKIHLKTPPTYGEIVDNYLKVLEENKDYDAWTVNGDLEVVECKGSIMNNGHWNHHNNYDDSENELYVKGKTKWFTLNKSEAIKIQSENIKEWEAKLNEELSRLEKINQNILAST